MRPRAIALRFLLLCRMLQKVSPSSSMVWQHLQNSPHSSGSSKKPFLTYWLPEVQERPFVCGPSLWDGVLETLWFCLLLSLQGQQQGHSLGFASCETKMVMPGAWFFFPLQLWILSQPSNSNTYVENFKLYLFCFLPDYKSLLHWEVQAWTPPNLQWRE